MQLILPQSFLIPELRVTESQLRAGMCTTGPNQPYWEFPQGIHFERFDLNLKVDANIHSEYAKFNENEQLWELRKNVKMTNITRTTF